jgi:hypothetical protein
MANVTISAVVSDLTFGDYTVEVNVVKASPVGPMTVVSKSQAFVVPGSPSPAPSLVVTVTPDA